MRSKSTAVIILTMIIVSLPSICYSKAQPPANKNPLNAYTIGTGDVLEIVTWKEPDFSRDAVIVRLDGKISFPLLDDVVAAGKTPMQLKMEIQKSLKAYVTDPQVTVTVKNAASKRFYILGEVLHTGEYPLTKRLTVLQAFAIAGGFTEWASKKEILLFRHADGKDKVIHVNYKQIVKGDDTQLNVYLEPDDTIVVP